MVDDPFARLIDAEERRGTDDRLLPPDTPADRVFVRRFLGAAARVRMEDVPAEVRRAVDARFEEWRVGRAPESLGGRIVAALSREVLPGTVVAGARGATAARHLVFASELADISVHVRAGRDGGAIDGMVLRADEADATDEVYLVRDGRTVVSTRSDPVGSFRLDGVPAGRYSLVASIDDIEIETAPFDVSAGDG